MKKNKFSISENKYINYILTLAVILTFNSLAASQKISPEELVAKHLESIGSAEARAAMKSVTIVGNSKATFFGRGGGVAEGIVVLASKGSKYLVGMKFNNAEYPYEKLGFNGSDFSVGFIRPGMRSNLGNFLRTNESTFKYGVMTGVLSTAWTLSNFDEKAAKIKYTGTKKIDGKKLHQLEYNPRKGSDLTINLFFDPDTFRHVRTEYRRTIAARIGASVDSSAGQSETRHTLIEEFSDFKEENKLTLPHTYKIYMEILTGNGTASYEWLMNFQQFNFNQEIDDKEFKVDAY